MRGWLFGPLVRCDPVIATHMALQTGARRRTWDLGELARNSRLRVQIYFAFGPFQRDALVRSCLPVRRSNGLGFW